jgi:acyl dehydratase
MQNYYYDVMIEDGTSQAGLRPESYRQVEKRVVRRFADVKVGDSLPPLVQGPITRTQIVKYAGASYDFNPIHHDEEFARKALSGGIIAHGMMIMGYLGKCATAYLGTAQFARFSTRNVAMTRPGYTLLIEGRVEEKKEDTEGGIVWIALTAKNQATGELLCAGSLECRLK